MSQIRLFQLHATPSTAINDMLQRNFSLAKLRQSLLRELAAIPITAFFTFACIMHGLVIDEQNQSEGGILLLWILCCIFASIQLALTCWLIYVIAPGIRLLFELVAWISYALGTIFCWLVNNVMHYVSGLVIFAIAIGLSFCALAINALWTSDFSFTNHSVLLLRRFWTCAGVILLVANLRYETYGPLIEYVTITIYWFCISGGVVLTFAIWLTAICLGIGGIILSGFIVFLTIKHRSDYNPFDTNYGTPLHFGQQPAIPPQVSVSFMD